MSQLVERKILQLDPALYPGGIAVWGALPAVYDTSVCLPEQGVHVHARVKVGGKKSIDETFDAVEVPTARGSGETFLINGNHASHYNISTILGRKLKWLRCPTCQYVHFDQGWYAVHYHYRHVCEHCGTEFDDLEPSISNPIMMLKELCGDVLQDRSVEDPVGRAISVRQSKYAGGVQLWGSNPAILWTSPKREEGGIHFHGFAKRNEHPTADETYGALDVDGAALDPEMVRHLMAQQALLYLVGHLTAISCPDCKNPHFDQFQFGVNPHTEHSCGFCRRMFASEQPVVSNPMIRVFTQLYRDFHALYPGVHLNRRFPWEPSRDTPHGH